MKISQLGKLIRQMRQEKRWTVSELARQANIDKSLVSRLETGACRSAHDDTLLALAAVLGVSFEQLKQAGYWSPNPLSDWEQSVLGLHPSHNEAQDVLVLLNNVVMHEPNPVKSAYAKALTSAIAVNFCGQSKELSSLS